MARSFLPWIHLLPDFARVRVRSLDTEVQHNPLVLVAPFVGRFLSTATMSRSLAFTSRGARESRARASEDAKGACVTMGSRISSIMESVNDPALREDPQLRSVVLELQRALGVIDPLLDKVERRLATSGESDRPEALSIIERSPTVVAEVSPGGTEDGFSPTKVLAAIVAENSGYAYHETKESEKGLERTPEGRTAMSTNNRPGEETGDDAAAKVVTETEREQIKQQVCWLTCT